MASYENTTAAVIRGPRLRKGDEVQGTVTSPDNPTEHFTGKVERLKKEEDGHWIVLSNDDGTWPIGVHRKTTTEMTNKGKVRRYM